MTSFRSRARAAAFTLIEIMIVVTIMAIVMAMSIPLAKQAMNRQGAAHITGKISDVCSLARQQAIMTGKPAYVVFHPQGRRFEVVASAAPAPQSLEHQPETPVAPDPRSSGEFPENVTIEMLDVNLIEHKDDEEARVRFNPNGTCDEFTIILFFPDNKSNRPRIRITSEVTTGQLSADDDWTKWR